MEQTCIKCGEVKSLTEYYAHPATRTGKDTKCKECVKAMAQQRRRDNPERAKDIDRRKYMKRREAHIKKSREWHKKNPDARLKHTNKWRSNNRHKQKAHNAVQHAIRRGDMQPASTQQCEDCGKGAHHYHHESYKEEAWLDVTPLCSQCHVNRHRST